MGQHAWILDAQQRCDLDLLLSGAYAPLEGYLSSRDYISVLERMTLADGSLWPIPIVLDVAEDFATSVTVGEEVLLTREDGTPLAKVIVSEVYEADLHREAQAIYGTEDVRHAGVRSLLGRHHWYIAGPVQSLDLERLELARRVDFLPLYRTPGEMRRRFRRLGKPVVAFHTRNPMHGAHYAVTRAAQELVDGHLLLHPTTGPTQPGDLSESLRLKAIWALAESYPLDDNGHPSVTLATIPLAMRMAGPREALWHALIRQNYGADYFIVGRAPADPGKNPVHPNGFWYPPYEAQELMEKVADKMKIRPLVFPEYAFNVRHQSFWPVKDADNTSDMVQLSGTKVRQMLASGEPLPEWYAPEPVRQVLQDEFRTIKQGGVIFLTGLPASGKSTLAKALYHVLSLRSKYLVTLLDGDVIRRHLSKGLGFTREDRIQNLERVGFVSQLMVQHGGLVVVAMVAPLEEARQRFRDMIEPIGDFIEIHVATSLEECERRDPKGLYHQARQGTIPEMTGIQSPYEIPRSPELRIVSGEKVFSEDLANVVRFLEERQLIQPMGDALLASVSLA